MRKFVDLHLLPSIGDPVQIQKMVERSSELGYHRVGISIPPDARRTTTRDEIQWLQKICGDVGIDLVTRVDLVPRSSRELLNGLRRFRRMFEVVSATCTSKTVARQAAKDRRVDLLSFPDPHKRYFDPAEAELASKALTALEIDMAPLLLFSGRTRTYILSRLRREAEIARKFDVPIVVSSGARKEHLLRSPHDHAALTALFDLDPARGLRALSENPVAIIERNRGKLSPDYVAPGIRIVRRPKDCSEG